MSSSPKDRLFLAIRMSSVNKVKTLLTLDPTLAQATEDGKSMLVLSREFTCSFNNSDEPAVAQREAQIEILLLTHGASALDLRYPVTNEKAWRPVVNTMFECFNRVAEVESTVAEQQRRLHAWLSALSADQRVQGLTLMANAWLKNLDNRSPLDARMKNLSEAVLTTLFQFDPPREVFAEAGPSGTHCVARRQVDERFEALERVRQGLAHPPERSTRRRLRT